MKVLIACEFSGIVREAFRARGHDAMSCDYLPTEQPGPHYEGDVRNIINDGWDLMIAHPPCTYIANVGVQHLHKDYKRWIMLSEAREFFMYLSNANIPQICVENPLPTKYAQLPEYNQIVNPLDFGDRFKKRTCLWLKNLPPLMSTRRIIDTLPRYYTKDGRCHGTKWYYFCKSENGKRGKERSRFFPGIAKAMAEQWG